MDSSAVRRAALLTNFAPTRAVLDGDENHFAPAARVLQRSKVF